MTPKKNGKAIRKTSGETSGTEVIGYGGNNNLTRGNPGNQGGGRQLSRIREICRKDFEQAAPMLLAIALDGDARDTDRIKATEVLGKYGGVDKLALTLEEQPEREMTPERIADIWKSIQTVKTIRQLEKMLVANEASE